MRKRASLRRWKARCRQGRKIPYYAIVDLRLDRWFTFTPLIFEGNSDVYMAVPR